jgi:CubicO group peptidase (beta-lactamase class C family)
MPDRHHVIVNLTDRPALVREPRFDESRLAAAFAVLGDQVAAGRVPGAVVAVAGPDGGPRIEAFGVGAEGEPVTFAHRFSVASVTKPIVATAVMQAIEEGLLSLETRIVERLPQFTPPSPSGGSSAEITVRQLLNHTSGVVDPPLVPDPRRTAERIIGELSERPLEFPPGTAFGYASDTFLLLAEIVRLADGTETFAESLRRRVLAPLAMDATSFRSREPGQPSAAAGMIGLSENELAAYERWFEPLDHPGGGLWSTAGDLIRFGQAMLNGGALGGAQVLSPESVQLMTSDQIAGLHEPGDPSFRPCYGLGWDKSTTSRGLPGSPAQFDHAGSSGSRVWIDPADGFVFAMVAGLWLTGGELSDEVIGPVYGALMR